MGVLTVELCTFPRSGAGMVSDGKESDMMKDSKVVQPKAPRYTAEYKDGVLRVEASAQGSWIIPSVFFSSLLFILLCAISVLILPGLIISANDLLNSRAINQPFDSILIIFIVVLCGVFLGAGLMFGTIYYVFTSTKTKIIITPRDIQILYQNIFKQTKRAYDR